MSQESSPIPIINGTSTFIPQNYCMVCDKYGTSPRAMMIRIGYPAPHLVYCANENCKRTAKYNRLRILCENNCVYEDPVAPLFGKSPGTIVIPRSDGSVKSGCAIQTWRSPYMSESRKCIGVWVSMPDDLEKLVTLRELISHNQWVYEKFKQTNGVQLVLKDSEFWSVPQFKEFREKVLDNIRELNEEFYSSR